MGGGYLFDYQVIVVDDGSMDDTSKILDEYESTNQRLTVFHVENGGAAKARKYGIDHSDSDYIAFCDSDDYVSQDWLVTLYIHLIQYDADFVLCGAYIDDKGIEKHYPLPYSIWEWNQEMAYEKFLEHKHLNGVLWTNLFKRSLFDGIEWRFDIVFGEDDYLIWQILSKVNKVVKIRVPKYHYMQNPESLTNRRYDHRRYHAIRVLTEFIVSWCTEGDSRRFLEKAKDFQYRMASGDLYAIITSDYKDEEAERYFGNIIRDGGIRMLHHRKGLKKKIITLACTVSPAFARFLYKNLSILKR